MRVFLQRRAERFDSSRQLDFFADLTLGPSDDEDADGEPAEPVREGIAQFASLLPAAPAAGPAAPLEGDDRGRDGDRPTARQSEWRVQEGESRAVTAACRNLVRQVQDIIAQRDRGEEAEDYTKLSSYELKTQEMEQQVEILKLENALSSARTRLGEMRKLSYQDE